MSSAKGRLHVVVESTPKRAFASALAWPGWSRGGRDPEAALAALAAYGPRYALAVGRAGGEVRIPDDASGFVVIERLRGDGGTDFGVPGAIAEAEREAVSGAELKRLVALLEAAWAAFDRAAKAARGRELRKGPRGGGRELDAIVAHVLDAEGAYLNRLGGRAGGAGSASTGARAVRTSVLDMIASRAKGEEPPMGRRTAPLWPIRYGIRRSAWHALDHAWELEDRSRPAEPA